MLRFLQQMLNLAFDMTSGMLHIGNGLFCLSVCLSICPSVSVCHDHLGQDNTLLCFSSPHAIRIDAGGGPLPLCHYFPRGEILSIPYTIPALFNSNNFDCVLLPGSSIPKRWCVKVRPDRLLLICHTPRSSK